MLTGRCFVDGSVNLLSPTQQIVVCEGVGMCIALLDGCPERSSSVQILHGRLTVQAKRSQHRGLYPSSWHPVEAYDFRISTFFDKPVCGPQQQFGPRTLVIGSTILGLVTTSQAHLCRRCRSARKATAFSIPPKRFSNSSNSCLSFFVSL